MRINRIRFDLPSFIVSLSILVVCFAFLNAPPLAAESAAKNGLRGSKLLPGTPQLYRTRVLPEIKQLGRAPASLAVRVTPSSIPATYAFPSNAAAQAPSNDHNWLLTIVGLGLVGGGAALALTATESAKVTSTDPLLGTVTVEAKSTNNGQRVAGLGLAGAGAVLFLLSLR